MKRAVITGPTGAVGVALVQRLVKEKVEVLAVCRKGSKRIGNIPKDSLVQVLELNLDELDKLPKMAEGTYDVFYHLGWDGTFGNSRNNMDGQLKNIEYTLAAVKAAKALGCDAFVGAGSQAEYGRVEGKLNAGTPPFPENGYGIAKLCAGQMSRILCEQYEMRHIWLRILSVYGPYDGANTMVMSVMRALMDGNKPKLTKGEQQWDYLYSKDAAKAIYLLGDKGKHGKIYCIGSGKTRPLIEYVEAIRNEVNPKGELQVGAVPYAPKQVMYLCADIEDLQKDTGFEPEYTFEEGIHETHEWMQQ
ncbi:MAG: NAD(P)-dependent oxidoreductase [Lachnospiraceae bacterium]|nr:NAD(P)-dependent oxidoreductase [Lachnospiraceae bacterium]